MPETHVHADTLSGLLQGASLYLATPTGHVVVATPKVAQTAIVNSIGGNNQVQRGDIWKYRATHAFIREPLERLESCWHYFNENDNWPVPRPASIEAFIDGILRLDLVDKHWWPQSDIWGCVPTYVHQFWDIEWWMAELGVDLRKTNSSKAPKAGITYRRDELTEFYWRDYLYASV